MKFIIGVFLIVLSGSTFSQEKVLDPSVNKGAGSYKIQLEGLDSSVGIDIFYYSPKSFNEDTSVIIVIPGAGRNANDYRDSWAENAEKYNLLVLSPSYPKKLFDFAAYHLGGVVNELELKNPKIEKINGRISKYRMNDEDITFSFVSDKRKWIFDNFDQIFSSVKPLLGAKQTSYDLFGHSAGGQILHRYALFKKNSKANRIVAANSGFYTLPGFLTKYPFGTSGTPLSKNDINDSFANHLIVLVGESDNANEKRGTMLHTLSADKQGLGRFERGKYFYNQSKKIAQSAKVTFNWQLKTVEGVGHDYRKMGNAAAKILYESNKHITKKASRTPQAAPLL